MIWSHINLHHTLTFGALFSNSKEITVELSAGALSRMNLNKSELNVIDIHKIYFTVWVLTFSFYVHAELITNV